MRHALIGMILGLASLLLVPCASVYADWDKGVAAYEAGDMETARDEWSASAQEGHSGSQYNLALMYLSGVEGSSEPIVPKDVRRAVNLMATAATQEHRAATYYLGIFYSAGMGVEKDDAESYCWFEKSARLGYSRGYFALGKIYVEGIGREKDLSRAHAFLSLGQAMGHQPSQELLDEVLAQMSDLSLVQESIDFINEWGQPGADAAPCENPGEDSGKR